MDRKALAAELNRLLASETRGLTAHLLEADPYLTPATYAIWRDVRHMIEADAHHAETISALLAKLELSERPASFRQVVASFHYMDLAFLLPLLVEEKQRQVAAYRRALEHARDEPDVSQTLQTLLDANEADLQQLEEYRQKVTGGSELAKRG